MVEVPDTRQRQSIDLTNDTDDDKPETPTTPADGAADAPAAAAADEPAPKRARLSEDDNAHDDDGDDEARRRREEARERLDKQRAQLLANDARRREEARERLDKQRAQLLANDARRREEARERLEKERAQLLAKQAENVRQREEALKLLAQESARLLARDGEKEEEPASENADAAAAAPPTADANPLKQMTESDVNNFLAQLHSGEKDADATTPQEEEPAPENADEKDATTPHSTPVTLAMLIAAGALTPGADKLSCKCFDNAHNAELLQDGRIHYLEMTFNSPSAFSVYCKRIYNPTRRADDGWESITYEGVTLNDMKKKFRERTAEKDKPTAIEEEPAPEHADEKDAAEPQANDATTPNEEEPAPENAGAEATTPPADTDTDTEMATQKTQSHSRPGISAQNLFAFLERSSTNNPAMQSVVNSLKNDYMTLMAENRLNTIEAKKEFTFRIKQQIETVTQPGYYETVQKALHAQHGVMPSSTEPAAGAAAQTQAMPAYPSGYAAIPTQAMPTYAGGYAAGAEAQTQAMSAYTPGSAAIPTHAMPACAGGYAAGAEAQTQAMPAYTPGSAAIQTMRLARLAAQTQVMSASTEPAAGAAAQMQAMPAYTPGYAAIPTQAMPTYAGGYPAGAAAHTQAMPTYVGGYVGAAAQTQAMPTSTAQYGYNWEASAAAAQPQMHTQQHTSFRTNADTSGENRTVRTTPPSLPIVTLIHAAIKRAALTLTEEQKRVVKEKVFPALGQPAMTTHIANTVAPALFNPPRGSDLVSWSRELVAEVATACGGGAAFLTL
ncbi:RAMA domain-containing protein [Pseudoscourfieldia marina]